MKVEFGARRLWRLRAPVLSLVTHMYEPPQWLLQGLFGKIAHPGQECLEIKP